MEPAATPDTWRLTLHQSTHGYRFALEAFLLADFVPAPAPDPLIDLGTGCGVVALFLARRFPRLCCCWSGAPALSGCARPAECGL